VALAEDFEKELGASLGEWHIAEFIDDEELDGGELGLEFEKTLFVTRLHQLMDEPDRRRKGDSKAALAGSEAERQAGMRPASNLHGQLFRVTRLRGPLQVRTRCRLVH
jgi:hypothetical protein